MLGVWAVLWAGAAQAGPITANASPAGGVPTLQKLVQNLGQSQVQGLLGSPSRRGGEVSIQLQTPAASVPGGGLSMVYVAGLGATPDAGTLQAAAAAQRAAMSTTTARGQNLGYASAGYSLGETLGVSVSELGGYLYVVHVPFNIAITSGYRDPGPADTGRSPIVIVPAPSSTMLGLFGLVLIGSGWLRTRRACRLTCT
jgi:hypothetical protein